MENSWRADLNQDSRQKIVSRIMDGLQRHMPVSGPEGMNELWKIAARFEEKIFTTAANQNDYLKKISLKMMSIEGRIQSQTGTLPTNSNGTSQSSSKPVDSGPAAVATSAGINQVQGAEQPINPSPSIGMQSSDFSSMANGLHQAQVMNVSGQASSLGLSYLTSDNIHMQNNFLNKHQRIAQLRQQQQQQQHQQAHAMMQHHMHQQSFMKQQPQLMLQQKTGLQQMGLQQQMLPQFQQQMIPGMQQMQPGQTFPDQNNMQFSHAQKLLQQSKLALQQHQQQPQIGAASAVTNEHPQQQSVSITKAKQPQSQPESSQSTSSLLTSVSEPQAQQSQNQAGSGQEKEPQRQGSLTEQQKQLIQQTRGNHEGSSMPVDLSTQMGHTGVVDPLGVLTMMQTMKQKYLQDLKDMQAMIDSRAQQLAPEQYQKWKRTLEPYINLLSAPRISPQATVEKLEILERQIQTILNSVKQRKQPTPQQHQVAATQAAPQQQPLRQGSQGAQCNSKQTEQPQSKNPTLSVSSHLQTNAASNTTLPMPQSLQQSMNVNTQSNALTRTTVSGINMQHQTSSSPYMQSSLRSMSGLNPQDQHFHQNRQIKDQEQMKQLQQRHLLQQQLQQKQQNTNPAMQQQLQAMASEMSGGDNKMAKHAAYMLYNQSVHQLNTRAMFQQHMQQQKQQQKLMAGQTSSPQMSPAPQSPQPDQQTLKHKTGTPLQGATPPYMVPSPAVSVDDSELKASTQVTNNIAHVATPTGQSLATSGLSASVLLADNTSSPNIANFTDAHVLRTSEDKVVAAESPMERLAKAIDRVSSRALASAISDMNAVICLSDMLASSAPGTQSMSSRACIGEDLAHTVQCVEQGYISDHDASEGGESKRKKRKYVHSHAAALISVDGTVTNSNLQPSPYDMTPSGKMPKVNLDEEISRVNEGLIDAHIRVDHDQAVDELEGIVVICFYKAVTVEPKPKSDGVVQPLRLLVPLDYPERSPIMLEDYTTQNPEYKMSYQIHDNFIKAVRSYSEPLTLEVMAKAWAESIHTALVEAAVLEGGGCFSSTYGSWENCTNT